MKSNNEWIANKLEKLISDIDSKKVTNKDYIRESLERFKHERIIHLLVTIFVWIFFLIIFIRSTDILMYIVSFILLVLEGFYLYHYYRLENWVQKLNEQYLKLISNKK